MHLTQNRTRSYRFFCVSIPIQTFASTQFSCRKVFLAKTVDIAKEISYLIKGLSLMPPSSRGLGHLPFTEVTGIRIPLGVLKKYNYLIGKSQT